MDVAGEGMEGKIELGGKGKKSIIINNQLRGLCEKGRRRGAVLGSGVPIVLVMLVPLLEWLSAVLLETDMRV